MSVEVSGAILLGLVVLGLAAVWGFASELARQAAEALIERMKRRRR